MFYSEQIDLPKTDLSKWRLHTTELGAERWSYEPDTKSPQDHCTQYLLGIDPKVAAPIPQKASDALRNGASFFASIQDKKSGTWPNEYKGPMFITIGYVGAAYFTKQPIPEPVKIELIRYLANTAHPVDGGWGLHEQDKSTCFGTTANYVVLRLLGVSPDLPMMVKARDTLHKLGGAIGCPHWGKIWLAVLNMYDWEGINPAPSELFTIPYWMPVHPMRWWVHTRAIYIAAGYLATAKASCPIDNLLLAIRTEIFNKPFDQIDWKHNRNNVCGVDLYYPHSKLLNIANWAMVQYEKWRPDFVKRYSNAVAYDLLLKELENTNYLAIAPVSGAFNAVVLYLEQGPDGEGFRRAFDRMAEELFLCPLGMTTMGTNGSQVWDASFAIQYLFVAGIAEQEQFRDMITRSFKFLLRSQFDSDCVPGSFRDPRKGAWPFSTKEQGYTVCDCTSESMKAILMVMNSDYYSDLHSLYDLSKLHNTIDVLLSLQNLGRFEFGSFASYEQIKAPPLLEAINPAEVFGNIMVEYPYVECTDSSVLGLLFYTRCQQYRSKEINIAVNRAIEYIIRAQNDDGSWYGSWGICYTYAGMFALEALYEVKKSYQNCDTVRKGCDFLVKYQLPDGGWGETMKASEIHTYISSKESLVVQTAWVVIGLLLGGYPDQEVIKRGVQLLLKKQQATGEWLYDGLEGVFNHSCAIEYPNYKFLFPIKAIGLYIQTYGDFRLADAPK